MQNEKNLFRANTAEAGSAPGYRRETHFDPVIRLHEVSDERLEALVNMNRNSDWDLSLACLGITVGFGQNAYSLAASVYNSQAVLRWDAIATVFFVLAVGVGGKSFLSWRNGKDDLRVALDALRSRPTRNEDVSVVSGPPK